MVTPWMCSIEPHTPDKIRAEDAQSKWSESDPLNPGMIRDWNDELQTLRDLECVSEADRLLRDRALYVDPISLRTHGTLRHAHAHNRSDPAIS
jgi:hypothetical protein